MSRSPIRTIWLEPSQTIARIAHENPAYRIYVLPILAGFAVLPTTAVFSSDDSAMRSGILLSTLMSFGPIFEVLQVFVGAYLIRVTGAWLGGKADEGSIQTAIVWGNVPIVALAVLAIPLSALSVVYTKAADASLSAYESPTVTGVGFVLLAVQVALVSWFVGIFWKGLAAVQGYSLGRAVLNSLIAWAIPAAVVLIGAAALGFSESVQSLSLAGARDLVNLSGE
jgi:hypothetical protein